jgi:hypothetical protein
VTAPPVPPARRRSNDLTGTWTFFIRTNEWTVDLRRAEGAANEYEGDGRRDVVNAMGTPVLLKIGAVLAKGRLKVWLGPGIVVCEAPFSAAKPMSGECRVVLGEGDPGPFRARRVP